MNIETEKIETTILMCSVFMISFIASYHDRYFFALINVVIGVYMFYRRFHWLENKAKEQQS